MEYLRWNERFSVGVEELDAQHRRLFALINDLQTATVFPKGMPAVAEALGRLNDYVTEHFFAEEAYMRQCAFPGLDKHRAEHTKFADKAHAFMKQLAEEGDDGIAEAILPYVKDWLVNHTLKIDRQYAEFVRDQSSPTSIH